MTNIFLIMKYIFHFLDTECNFNSKPFIQFLIDFSLPRTGWEF